MVFVVDLLLLAVGLSMDAFAVSICKGLAMSRIDIKKCATVGLWFGGFQALMPLAGWLLSSGFYVYIERYSAWVSFLLLGAIGGNMIKEALSKKEEKTSDSLSFSSMFIMAVATSIDALAVGVTFTAQGYDLRLVLISVAAIGVVTFLLSAIGVKAGSIGGKKYKSKAEFAGGVILILLGLKILMEHYGVI